LAQQAVLERVSAGVEERRGDYEEGGDIITILDLTREDLESLFEETDLMLGAVERGEKLEVLK